MVRYLLLEKLRKEQNIVSFGLLVNEFWEASSSHIDKKKLLILYFGYFTSIKYNGFFFFFKPLMQILVWFVMPMISFNRINTPYLLIILIQCTVRFYIIIPISKQIINVAGFIAKTAWGGAIYNLLLYLLASHVSKCSLPFSNIPYFS